MSSWTATILAFHVQSGNITFSEWVSLFTVVFAVIIAHVAAGVPSPSILTQANQPLPAWHDLMVHYNPTSILWRYIAIADRRLRTRGWSSADMAAANALFWTDKGWDGSEQMIAASLRCFVRLPEGSHVSFASFAMLQTIIVAVQGVQAIYLPVNGLSGGAGAYFFTAIAVDQIFFPVAIFGLIRLGAALWLTDDYAYLAPSRRKEKQWK